MSQSEATEQNVDEKEKEKEKETQIESQPQSQQTEQNETNEQNESQNVAQTALQQQTVKLESETQPQAQSNKLGQNIDMKEQENVTDQSSATTKVMRSLSSCLINEIQSSRIDYSLLRELNNKSAIEYIDMTQRAKLLLQSMNVMNEQENQLMQELTKIDDLVEEVNKLDSVVRKLDEYSKNLHAQFHKLYSTK